MPGFEDLQDITYHRSVVDGPARGTVRIAFDRPSVRNAFRPATVDELAARWTTRAAPRTSAACC